MWTEHQNFPTNDTQRVKRRRRLMDIRRTVFGIHKRLPTSVPVCETFIYNLSSRERVKIKLNEDRLVDTMQAQATIGQREGGGLDRVALSPADGEVRDWFHEAMLDAGLAVRIDEVGNVFGRREGTELDAPPVLLGSHLDSQPNGGIYDGSLGVVAALETVRTLNDHGIETDHPLEIVNWTDEEGTRFQPAGHASGSSVWVGECEPADAYTTVDSEGVRFGDALERIGYRGNATAAPGEPYEAYLELHIEQGPRLADAEKDIGIVTGIVSRSWGSITFIGEAEHSGTTPMEGRRDALVAAAEMVTAIRRIAAELGENTVGTAGSIEVVPNSINVVPERATVTWGFRDPSDSTVDTARAQLLAEAATVAEREGVEWEYTDRMRTYQVDFSNRCIDSIRRATERHGYGGVELVGGAGHDATSLAKLCDAGMVFAVSENGKSHCPEEYTTWEHCYRAANVLATAAVDLATVDSSRDG